tara:strand:- start:28902 stop:29087 length:186 start_codon:yes stop_codon:yes gene_type:complete
MISEQSCEIIKNVLSCHIQELKTKIGQYEMSDVYHNTDRVGEHQKRIDNASKAYMEICREC